MTVKSVAPLLWLAFLTISIQGCNGTPPPPSPPACDEGSDADTVCHSLGVSRHSSTSLTDARTDAILADATTVARVSDGAGDVACNVALRRDGTVTTFSDGSGIVNSSAGFASIMGLPGHVKIVNQINWCGSFKPNIIGCAPVPGDSLAVVRFTASQEGILWLHEFGHNKGLSHRSSLTRAVMYPSIGGDHNFLDVDECNAVRQTGGAGPLVTDAGTGQVEAGTDIRTFVRRIYIDGIPVDQAAGFDSSVVPTLLEMLDDEQDRAYWPNIVATLGIVGEEPVADSLESYVSAGDGTLSPERYAATSAAVIALGYLAHRAESDRPIGYLSSGSIPDRWNDRVQWTSPYHGTSEGRNAELAQLSIIGLALSGREAGREALRRVAVERGPEASPLAGELLTEALAANTTIASDGLDSYYQQSR